MKKVKTVIFGGTCRAAGQVINEPEVLVIERSASIGGEYFDAYKKCNNWDLSLKSATACEFRKEMVSRQIIRGEQTDFYGLAPLVYFKLKNFTDRIMMMTELVDLKQNGTDFELTLYNQSGRQVIGCDEIIDNSVSCVTSPEFGRSKILSKKLNAIVYTENLKEALSGKIPGAELSQGRNEKELILRFKVKNDAGFAEARKQLFAVWDSRPAELADCRISSIAKEFDYEFKETEHQFSENWKYVNPVNYANPLLAIDSGAIKA